MTTSPPIEVADTNLIFRLSPAIGNSVQSGRQIAIVSAETEKAARALATISGPMGRDWNDSTTFTAENVYLPGRQVIGDIVFQYVPAPRPSGQERPRPLTKRV